MMRQQADFLSDMCDNNINAPEFLDNISNLRDFLKRGNRGEISANIFDSGVRALFNSVAEGYMN